MSEYIDRDALLSELKEEIEFETPMYTEEQNRYFNCGLRCAIKDVNKQPAVDVVEVVRCKNCAHYIEMEGFECNGRRVKICAWHDALRDENDYCSDSKRITNTTKRGARK